MKQGKIGPIGSRLCTFDWCFKTCASFGVHHENLNEDRLYCQRRRCSRMTLDSDDIRFVRIFAGVSWKGGIIQQWGNWKRVVWAFGCCIFSILENEANIIYYIVLFSPLLPFHWPQNTWLWMAWRAILRYMFTIMTCHWLIICYLFTVVCLLHLWPTHVTSGEVREAELQTVIRRIFGICGKSADLPWMLYRRNLNK